MHIYTRLSCMSHLPIMIIAWIVGVLTVITPVQTERLEVCPYDGRQILCNDHHVIVIQTALYGRMQSGGCIPNANSIGCSVDVFSRIDKWCSGFRECFLDEGFTAHLPLGNCPQQLNRYLEVTYTCQPVAEPVTPECTNAEYLPTILRKREGFISSFTTYETSCGYTTSPWVIEAPENHIIQLHLFDFTPLELGRSSPGRDSYGVIVEEGDPMTTTRFRRGEERTRPLYESTGNRLIVYLENNYEYRFLVHYTTHLPTSTKGRTLAVSSGHKVYTTNATYLLAALLSVRSVWK